MQSNIAEDVIKAFGGLTRAAKAIGAPISTVQSWQETGRIPAWRRAQIIAAAERAKVALPIQFLERAA